MLPTMPERLVAIRKDRLENMAELAQIRDAALVLRCAISRDRPKKPVLDDAALAALEQAEEMLKAPDLSGAGPLDGGLVFGGGGKGT